MTFADKVKHEERTLGGRKVPVAMTPRTPKPCPYTALRMLWDGMKLTLGYFVHPSTIVTRQYPENRSTLKFPPRYRAMLKLIYEDNGCHRCTACRLCDKACPNGSIKVLTTKSPVTGKVCLDRYIWRLDSCTFCNACVQACPFSALEMTHDFENAVYDRRLLVFNLNRYAGPPANIVMKEPDPQVRQKMMEPRDRYGGPVPMNGTALPNLRPLAVDAGSGGHGIAPRQIPLSLEGEDGPKGQVRVISPSAPAGGTAPGRPQSASDDDTSQTHGQAQTEGGVK